MKKSARRELREVGSVGMDVGGDVVVKINGLSAHNPVSVLLLLPAQTCNIPRRRP